jgi:hypothetical protein
VDAALDTLLTASTYSPAGCLVQGAQGVLTRHVCAGCLVRLSPRVRSADTGTPCSWKARAADEIIGELAGGGTGSCLLGVKRERGPSSVHGQDGAVDVAGILREQVGDGGRGLLRSLDVTPTRLSRTRGSTVAGCSADGGVSGRWQRPTPGHL